MMYGERIISLFEKYGFKYRKSASEKEFLAFTFKSGFFNNAEIVSFGSEKNHAFEKEINKSLEDLEKLGFSTKKSHYNSVDEIESALFDGFFDTKNWKIKIDSDYSDHCKCIIKSIPIKSHELEYSYIHVPYLKNGKTSEQSNIINDICKEVINEAGPRLFIIEAPAGFGKTCTSYEIIKALNNDFDNAPMPFFTEFSRDRQAKIFSHILIREVDRSFSSVNSDLVIDEVKAGKIVIVLDGFDELLHNDSSNKGEEHFENAEPMLETISELLVGNAKIILTSRRSAIFDGERFNEWVERYNDRFIINRYKLDKPEIKQWMPSERIEKLNKVGIDLSKMANPVLLSFLRFIDDGSFDDLLLKPNSIVDHYFFSMLEREMDRQDLRMNPEQQTDFLKLISADMCDKNYTTDSKENIIDLIKSKVIHILNEVRALYPPKDKPSIDKLATTLSNHAFLDKSSDCDDNISFVNEFVFGNYIAENIIHSSEDWLASDERFVEPAVLSYVARTVESRQKLWNKLKMMNEFLDISSRIKFEAYLTDSVSDNVYDNAEITSVAFKSIRFFETGSVSECVFNDCTFHQSWFFLGNIKDITFINCKFWNCECIFSENSSVGFYNCTDNNDFLKSVDSKNVVPDENLEQDVRFYILSKIWPSGSPAIERLHYFTASLFKTNDFSRKQIMKELKSMRKEGMILDANDSNFIAVNKTKISEIKSILKRV